MVRPDSDDAAPHGYAVASFFWGDALCYRPRSLGFSHALVTSAFCLRRKEYVRGIESVTVYRNSHRRPSQRGQKLSSLAEASFRTHLAVGGTLGLVGMNTICDEIQGCDEKTFQSYTFARQFPLSLLVRCGTMAKPS